MSMIIGNVDENDSFNRREGAISPGTFLFLFVLLHVLRDPLLSGVQLPFHGVLYFVRDGEHEVGPEGQAAGGGEKVHGAEKGFADFLAKQLIENSAHFAIQLTGDGEHFPVVRDFFSRRADFLLEGVQFGEGAGEAFEEVHVGGVE